MACRYGGAWRFPGALSPLFSLPMKRILKWLAILIAGLLLLAFGLRFALPPVLDDIYYEGPRSWHFDGERFFNPDGYVGPPRPSGSTAWLGFFIGRDRAEWPVRVPVSPGKPPARVQGEAMQVTWIGHATVLVQTRGLNILTDPIWSHRASPFPFGGAVRVRAPGVRFDDLPKIDLVLISHNHYDHMDIATLKRLSERDNPLIVTNLGNDEILKRHGVFARAADWGGRVPVRDGVEVIVERVHHWSSRWGADRNRALWSGFTVTLPGGNLFFAGDTGLGDGNWASEAGKRGPVRLAILPVGAYQPREIMTDSHVDPDEAVEIFERLDAANAVGVHWGTFQLTDEPINEPVTRLAAALSGNGIDGGRFRTPEAGQSWNIPSLATASSDRAMPKRVAGAAR